MRDCCVIMWSLRAVLPVLFVANTVIAAEPVQMYGASGQIKASHRFSAHDGEIVDAVFTGEGQLLTAGADGALRLWDVESARCVQTVAKDQHGLKRLLAAPDRRWIVSLHSNGAICVWRLSAPEPPSDPVLHRFAAHDGEILDAVFTRDSQLLTAGADGALRLWDLESARCVQTIATDQHGLTKLLAAPDQGRIISLSFNDEFRVWQLPAPMRAWGPEQVTGPPDTPEAGDQATAWASATEDGQPEWLLVAYSQPVRPTAVHVYQTFNPGALTKVTAFRGEEEVTVWEGQDPVSSKDAMGVAELPVDVDFEVDRVKLYFDSPKIEGWNEIDAVGLIDHNGQPHWASAAAASSTYGETHSIEFVR